MKRKPTLSLVLVALAALTFGSHAARAGHHWGYNNGMGAQGYSQLTQNSKRPCRSYMTITMRKPAPCASSCSPNATSTMRCLLRQNQKAEKLRPWRRKWKH